MKRVGNLYSKVTNLNNIEYAILMASKGKKNRKMVEEILDYSKIYARKIQKMLVDKTYVPSLYKKQKIYDGARKKERYIFKPKFYPDQCIHWALMLYLEPILMKKMYCYNCASIKGRGIHYGVKYLKKILVIDRKNTKYCSYIDI